jgi:hypothetical protein
MAEERFRKVRDAKEFLASKIAEEATREEVPLSEIEHKMLFFSERGWTLPDMKEVSDAFDRDYDQNDYEKKISRLIKGLDKRIRKENAGEYEDWRSAINFLKRKDHYINVMISHAGLRPRGDQLKLWATGLTIVAAISCVAILAGMYNIDLDRYLPSRSNIQNLILLAWLVMIAASILYYLSRFIFGAAKVNELIGKLLRKMLRVTESED